MFISLLRECFWKIYSLFNRYGVSVVRQDLNESEIIRRFQIRRRLALLAVVLFPLDVLFILSLGDPDFTALLNKQLLVGSLLLASPFIFLGLVVLVYRCPRCQMAPFWQNFDSEGVIIMKGWAAPKRCEHCGARLK